MEKHDWVTWMMFLQTAETLPQDEGELEISTQELLEHFPVFGVEDDN